MVLKTTPFEADTQRFAVATLEIRSNDPFDTVKLVTLKAFVECRMVQEVSFLPGGNLSLGVSTANASLWGGLLFIPGLGPFSLFVTALPECASESFDTGLVNPGSWFFCTYLYDFLRNEFQIVCGPGV